MVSISASRLDRPLLRGEVVEQDVRGDLPRPDRDAACQVLQVLATCAVGRGPLPERAIVTQEPLSMASTHSDVSMTITPSGTCDSGEWIVEDRAVSATVRPVWSCAFLPPGTVPKNLWRSVGRGDDSAHDAGPREDVIDFISRKPTDEIKNPSTEALRLRAG